jgi:hypothetical protein
MNQGEEEVVVSVEGPPYLSVVSILKSRGRPLFFMLHSPPIDLPMFVRLYHGAVLDDNDQHYR